MRVCAEVGAGEDHRVRSSGMEQVDGREDVWLGCDGRVSEKSEGHKRTSTPTYNNLHYVHAA